MKNNYVTSGIITILFAYVGLFTLYIGILAPFLVMMGNAIGTIGLAMINKRLVIPHVILAVITWFPFLYSSIQAGYFSLRWDPFYFVIPVINAGSLFFISYFARK